MTSSQPAAPAPAALPAPAAAVVELRQAGLTYPGPRPCKPWPPATSAWNAESS